MTRTITIAAGNSGHSRKMRPTQNRRKGKKLLHDLLKYITGIYDSWPDGAPVVLSPVPQACNKEPGGQWPQRPAGPRAGSAMRGRGHQTRRMRMLIKHPIPRIQTRGVACVARLPDDWSGRNRLGRGGQDLAGPRLARTAGLRPADRGAGAWRGPSARQGGDQGVTGPASGRGQPGCAPRHSAPARAAWTTHRPGGRRQGAAEALACAALRACHHRPRRRAHPLRRARTPSRCCSTGAAAMRHCDCSRGIPAYSGSASTPANIAALGYDPPDVVRGWPTPPAAQDVLLPRAQGIAAAAEAARATADQPEGRTW
jgi:hypothetical protein